MPHAAVSDADSDSRSRASTDDADDSLEALLGDADPNLRHDLARCGLSSPWATAVQSDGSKMLPDPPTAKSAKPAASSDDDDIDSLRSQRRKTRR